MIVKNHPDAPKYGFLIRSDGSILVGDPGSYSEEDVKEWFGKWMVMRSAGCFDEKPEDQTASSSQAAFVPVTTDEKNGESKIEDEMKQTPLSPKKSKKKNKKDKKKGRH
jgi:hypothetical protein